MDKQKLKYIDIISNLNLKIECPFKSCIQAKILGYRWVNNPIDHPDNFKPNTVLENEGIRPVRKNSNDDNATCGNCAISFFDSEDNARRRFINLPSRIQCLIGYAYIASGKIDVNDGLVTQIGTEGHFNLFEFEGVDLTSKFVIISKIIK